MKKTLVRKRAPSMETLLSEYRFDYSKSNRIGLRRRCRKARLPLYWSSMLLRPLDHRKRSTLFFARLSRQCRQSVAKGADQRLERTAEGVAAQPQIVSAPSTAWRFLAG